MMQEMGLQPDYSTEIAPDPLDGELDRAREILRQLTGRPQPVEQKLFRGFDDRLGGLILGHAFMISLPKNRPAFRFPRCRVILHSSVYVLDPQTRFADVGWG